MSTLSSIFSSTSRGIATGSGQIYFGMGPNGEDIHFSFATHTDAIKAYRCSPSVSTIVDRKAQAHIYGETFILNTQGKAKGKEATGEVATRLRRLLERPNPRQSWADFEAELKIYVLLFGYCPILPIKSVGFDATYATALWIIPPQYLEIEVDEVLFYKSNNHGIRSVKITADGQTASIPPDSLFFVKDSTINTAGKVLPGSRIEPLQQAINNEIGTLESMSILVNQRGALGILSNETKDAMGVWMPLDAAEKAQMQKELMGYGLRTGQAQTIISSASLKWQQIGYPTKDLMLFEQVASSTMTICDKLGYPYRLLSQEKSASYNDVSEFKKMLYADFIIPEAKNIYKQLNNLFELAKYGLTLDKDFSHIPVLQDDEEKKARARKLRNEALETEFLNNIITLNRWLEINGEDPLTGAEGAMYYYQLVELGWQFGHASTKDRIEPTGQDSQDSNSNNQNTQEEQQ